MNNLLTRNDAPIESKSHLFDYYFMKVSDEKQVFNRVMPSAKFLMREKNDLKKTNPELYTILLDNQQTRHTYMSDDGMYLYHVGIIDYLQEFNVGKKLENFAKGFVENKHVISAVPAAEYGQRFFEFMQKYVVTNQITVNTCHHDHDHTNVTMEKEMITMKRKRNTANK